MDSDAIVSEYEDFCKAFRDLKTYLRTRVEMNDMPSTANDFSYSDDSKEQESSGEETDEVQLPAKKEQHSLIVPLTVLYELSSYTHLLRLYWTLVTLPVTSCSAERASSRLRIIKNRLRSSMCDEWVRALMVLASEKDILATINTDDIIDSFASLNGKLKQQLLYV